MSKDKREDDAKKIVKEETEPAVRSDAPCAETAEAGSKGDSGTCSRICGVTWRTTRIQKKDEEPRPPGQLLGVGP